MTDRYWIRNGAASSAFSTAAYWNTAVDGSGSAGVPTTGDDIYIGSPDTLAVGIGNATCVWDSAITVGDFITHSGYTGATVTSDLISFQAPDLIQHANKNWADLGFREGMAITTTGATSSQNNDSYIIQTITDNLMTVASGVSNVADEAAGATVTMTCSISLRIEADTTMDKFTLDCTVENTTGGNVTITFSSSYPASSGERYVLNGDNAVINNKDDITYAYNTSANGTTKMHFDDGPHPKVTVAGASYISPEYKTPTSTLHGETSIHSLSLGASTVFQPDASPTASSTLNASKVFSILTTSTLAIGGSVFDAGFSTFSFTMDATNFTIPVTGDTTYGTAPFKARFYNLIIATPSTAGFKALVPNDRTLSVNSLTVEADAVLKGHATAGGDTTSTICSVSRPRIQGSWNFSQLSDGVYVSLMSDTFPITPSSGPVGRVQFSNDGGTFSSDSKLTWTSATSTLLVDGKLTVTGLIDPTGMEFTAVASNPSTANPAKTIWVNSGDSNKLYFGSSAVGGGGGGSGTVTSVAVSGSDGIQVDSGSPITTNGTIALGVDKNTLLSHINVDDGADVTNATTVTAAGALMDSEVTNLAQVKAFDSADYATAAQGTTADNALPKAGGQMTGNITMSGSQTVDGRDLSVDGAKLDGISSGATANTGTVTSVATTAPITGGTITSTGTVGFDISGLTANTAIADADLLLLDDGANGTNRKITFTEVKEWIRGEGIIVGRDGGVNQLRIRDSRDDGELTPDDFLSKQVSFDFTDDIAGSTNSWDAVMTMKGWTDSYRVFQLFSSASSEGSSGKDTEPLYFRSGEDTGWGALRQVLTFPGTTPNADGSSGQVLQTNGSGALSWATVSGGGGAKQTCMVRLATDIPSFTPAGAYVLLNDPGNWDALSPDFDTGTGLYTVPVAGVYRISWSIAFRFMPPGQAQFSRIYVNGNYAAQGQGSSTGNWPVFGGSILLELQQGDAVGLYVYISNTGKTLVGDSLSIGATQMSINEVG